MRKLCTIAPSVARSFAATACGAMYPNTKLSQPPARPSGPMQ